MTTDILNQTLDELENMAAVVEQLQKHHGDNAAEVAYSQALLAQSQRRYEDHQMWVKVLVLMQEP